MNADNKNSLSTRPAEPARADAITRLQPLLAPRSVAVVGASATPGKYGNTVLQYLRRAGYGGRIYPINPEGGIHDGLQFYRSLEAVPEQIDCAFTVIPAAATPAVVRSAASARVRALIIGASGFAEMGSDAGRARQREIEETARAAGMIVLGPNTNGIWNAHHKLALGYNTSHGEPMRSGPVSIAAHSGALFDSFLPRLAQFGAGFGKLVPLGNEALLDMLEVLDALIEDPETQVIGLIMEAIRDGDRFRTLAARAHAAGKPLFVLKLGRSAAGATAAIAHSSRLAGSMRAYEALLRDCGVPTVRSIETLAAVCTIASDPRALRVRGDTRLIGVSGSGGGCSLMADHAAEREIVLAGDGAGTWEGETARLIATFKGIGLVRNPIDGGNLHGWDKLPSIIEAMERDGLSGPIAGFAHRLPTLASDMALFTPLAERKQRTGSPVVMMSPGGQRPEMQARYAAEGIPLFPDLAACFDSLRAYYDALTFAREREANGAGEASAQTLPPDTKRAIEAKIAAAGGTFLSELDSADVLRMAGINVIESRVVASADEAGDVTAAIGFPVVMKAIVPGIAHKNDAGLVVVGVRDGATAREAFGRLEKTGAQTAGRRIVVQRMVPSRAEIIVGTTHEPGLGHFLLAGLGGVHAEVLDSVLLLPVWVAPERIRLRLGASKLGALLARLGRGSGRDHMEEVARTLDALQRLVCTVPDAIRSIDVNPLMIGPGGAMAVDALVVPRLHA